MMDLYDFYSLATMNGCGGKSISVVYKQRSCNQKSIPSINYQVTVDSPQPLTDYYIQILMF